MIVLLIYIAIGLILFFGFSQTVNSQIQNKEKNQVVGMNNYKWENNTIHLIDDQIISDASVRNLRIISF